MSDSTTLTSHNGCFVFIWYYFLIDVLLIGYLCQSVRTECHPMDLEILMSFFQAPLYVDLNIADEQLYLFWVIVKVSQRDIVTNPLGNTNKMPWLEWQDSLKYLEIFQLFIILCTNHLWTLISRSLHIWGRHRRISIKLLDYRIVFILTQILNVLILQSSDEDSMDKLDLMDIITELKLPLQAFGDHDYDDDQRPEVIKLNKSSR